MSSLFGGGDSADDYTPPPTDDPPDYGSIIAPMMEMMSGTMAQMAAQQASMMNNMMMMTMTAPDTTAVPDIDWEKKDAELRSKVAADAAKDARARKGRGDTILTSPLDDSDTKVTDSILNGK